MFERAALIEPSVQAHNNGANAFLLKSRLESARGIDPRPSLLRAEDLYRSAAELSPVDVNVQGNLTLVMRDLAEWEEEHGGDPTPRMLEAIRILEEQLERAPEALFLHITLSSASRELARSFRRGSFGDPAPWLERARTEAARAVELSPTTFGPWWAQAEAEAETARWLASAGHDPEPSAQAALAALERYDELFPDQAKSHRLRGSIWARAGPLRPRPEA